MSAANFSIEDYVAMQPRIAWRRNFMRQAIRTILFRLFARVRVSGEDNIPLTQPTILIINHTSLLDPVLGMGAVRKRYVIPMSKLENRRNPVIASLIWWWGAYYVNRGQVDRQALQASIELLRSGQLLLISPEGTRHPEGLQEAKDGIAYYATKADAVIVPMAITGTFNWPRLLFTLRRPRMHVTFGRPFRLRTNGRARIPRDELAQMTRETMYQLAATLPDPALRGIYHDLSQLTTDTLDFVQPD